MRITASIVAVALTSLLAAPASAQTTPPPAPAPANAAPAPSLAYAAPVMPLPPPPGWAPAPIERHRNRAAMITGMVFVGLAGAATTVGIAVIFAPNHCSGFLCGLDRVGQGGLTVLSSMALAGLGSGLWAYGAPSPTPDERGAAWLRPSVAVGPGSASLKWSF